ncbi:MAG: phage portal protein, partial [Desulfocurvibacter africanus]
EAWVSNMIGTGIVPQWEIESATLKTELQQLWEDWTDEADSDGVSDFYGLQALTVRAMAESGECLIRFRPRRMEDGLAVPLQLQVLEADHLDDQKNEDLQGGGIIRMGVEFDREGRRVAYYLFPTHPGENSSGASEAVRVPASEILHVYRPLRPGQVRGRPWLTSIILKLRELDQYEDAELVRKKTAALFAGFITRTKSDDGGPIPGFETDESGKPTVALEPGILSELEPGEDITFSQPADSGPTYEAWIKQQLREVARGIGVTYEQLTGDLRDVNYSSIRAGLVEFRRRCEALQWHTVVFQMCRPVARRWLELAVASGAINLPGFVETPRQYLRIKWRPQGFQWVDPLKEVTAQQVAVRCGFKSRAAVIGETGYDPEQVDREIAEDAARADGLGLVFDSDPRKTAKAGQAQAGKENAE